ncbi:uncharacterized protein LOC128890751 isoform X2 [Hylaeus anthracinus]|uniref:uncharacterized protein LOC128890751 isoform X2 n=1 Tax=Hylaeus anthracinus TaxID=313031 RepID=UPI0023BA38FF|nr:uncharacterized protein LOC128890751 isoform X2 [Hylaeus anthracinus]
MELLMEKSSSICIQTIIDNIVSYLSGDTCKNIPLVKVSNNNLSTNGELYFSPNLKVWKSILHCRNICDGKCATILEHFLHVHSSDISDKTETDVAKQVLELLILSSCNWQIKIERYLLEKERVCLFLYRTPLITDSIKAVIHLKCNFGKPSSINKVFSLKTHEDEESELTTARLHLIRSVTENILNLHGCRTGEEEPDFKLVFTSKSQGNANENYERCVCGVVKNIDSNTKETTISWKEYIRSKIKELEAVNDEKFCELYEHKLQADGCFFENVAKAMITFQLLSVKPSRSIVIGCNSAPNRAITNMKDASFILYNTVRITAIIEKYNDKRSIGKYPDLPNIDDVNFSLLDDENGNSYITLSLDIRQ